MDRLHGQMDDTLPGHVNDQCNDGGASKIEQKEKKCVLDSAYMRKCLFGKHYIELLLTMLHATHAYKGAPESRVFGLYLVDHRVFITTLEGSENIKQNGWRFDCGQLDRNKRNLFLKYRVVPSYLNLFCSSHRRALVWYLWYVTYIQHARDVEDMYSHFDKRLCQEIWGMRQSVIS